MFLSSIRTENVSTNYKTVNSFLLFVIFRLLRLNMVFWTVWVWGCCCFRIWLCLCLMCVLLWAFRFLTLVNLFVHFGQGYGFSPVCVFACTIKAQRREKVFWQVDFEQANGFSLVCTLMWSSNSVLLKKHFEQNPQEKRFHASMPPHVIL